MVLYFDPLSNDGKVHVRDKFFAVRHLNRATGQGLFDTLMRAVEYVGIKDWSTKMVGFGCDGTNANLAEKGLKGHLTQALQWLVVFWCLAHRLELALKDAWQQHSLQLLMTFFCVYTMYTRSHLRNASSWKNLWLN